ncbi:BQ2448_6949 [Microbotryum intermedium]|uniref:Phosphatidylethanolamine N-methyltransferase n=1 Tax=Microbotryum intermedium TaxID=269621 RepID=A0A238FMD3_9BASI|nr:BQ2448_6949 [Microbotryum intermedium]
MSREHEQDPSGLRRRAPRGATDDAAAAIATTTPETVQLPQAPPSSSPSSATSTKAPDSNKSHAPLGKTPDGKVFRIPRTHDMLSSLFDPRLPKSHIDLLTLLLLAAQVVLFLSLPLARSRYFFLGYFALWRLAYNCGLGIVLKRQSEHRWIVRTVVRQGWMDPSRRPRVHQWVTSELKAKMGADYAFEAVPIEFNVWIMFRHFVDVILLNDFLSYCFFALSFLQTPPGHSTAFHVLRWTGGVTLILFNFWVKVDAHRIVKDYAWYWGDAFFLSLQELVFDGVFEASLRQLPDSPRSAWGISDLLLINVLASQFAPHPMYSVGYAGYYGLSLLVASETVLFVSMLAHACQFGFLVYFENPREHFIWGPKPAHIERIYGQRKPLAARTAQAQPSGPASSIAPAVSLKAADGPKTESSTPDLTDHTHTGSESEFEADPALSTPWMGDSPIKQGQPSHASSSTQHGAPLASMLEPGVRRRRVVATRHDLDNHYFRNDLLVFKNLDVFRNRDLAFLLVVFYGAVGFFMPSLGSKAQISLAFVHTLAWRCFHSFGLGLALKAQSERKWIVRHFLKHYHYEMEGEAVDDAFKNWKATYNMSLCMSYGTPSAVRTVICHFECRARSFTEPPSTASFGALAWKCYSIPVDWTVGSQLVRHVLGVSLVALHVWTAQSTLDVLGPFGWFYGDFFIQEYPHQLYYTGIFRFLNNPERSMGGAAFFGMVLISGSKLLLFQAVIAVAAHWWFLSVVENPHMRRLYGNTLRQDAGVTKTIRSVAARNAHVFGGVSRGVREVQGSLEKVLDETADVLEEFLNRSGPIVKDYVNETKVLLKQTSERLVIRYEYLLRPPVCMGISIVSCSPTRSCSRVAHDLNEYDASKYGLTLSAPQSRSLRRSGTTRADVASFHLGQPIRVQWQAPLNHSRKDWIGIYRQGANQSQLVTRVSSQGHWLGVHEHEWRGDKYEGTDGPAIGDATDIKHELASGSVTFSGARLPWSIGSYEIRYHHDGKHSVMARAEPVHIYVEEPNDANDPQEIYETLTVIVAHALASDPAAIPKSASRLLQYDNHCSHNNSAMSEPLRGDNDRNNPTNTQELVFSDKDDFAIYSIADAKHIAYAIKEAFEVELASEVIMAAANVMRLANRVVEARKVLLATNVDYRR